ncbi:hypothetical protein AB1Y20_005642 [Prymnesium parvum]|uniref:DYW domain-containing protein n=1 Tax=Prymnesium parvum TaxID=97485 RepID=A0AB34J712_PRYPA
MRRAGVSPNDFSYATAISACDAGGQWVRGLQLLDDMRLAGHPPSVVACSAAISACAKAGAWTQAVRLLLRMPAMGARPNIYSYNAAITACTRASEWRAALALLRRMRTRRAPPPNTVSYNAAIAACARGGAWEHALGLLQRMRRDGVRRDGVTYNSVLDALARRGRWEEAVALLERMARGAADGVRPDAIAIHSAVGACEAAGEWRSAVRLLEAAVAGGGGGGGLRAAGGSAVRACAAAGEAAAAAALLERCERTLGVRLPPSAYAAVREAASRGAPLPVEQYERLFKGGAQKHLAKGGERGRAAPPKPLASFVLEGAEVSCAHGENRSSASDIFLSPQPGGRVRTVDASAEARAFVSAVRRRSAYTPLLAALPSTVARGRSRARQQQLLSQHAEKKAIAAQLSLDYREPYAKLAHCMCRDCHECFKAASRVYALRIVCDDSRMRHVFEGGECSCGDCWRTPLRGKET